MSDKETVACWACEKSVPKTADVCPHCDMPLKESSQDIDDIDSFLDDLDTKSSESDQADMTSPAIPEFSEEMPDIPDFDDGPAIPEFSEDMPDIPDFASDLITPEPETEEQITIPTSEEEEETTTSVKIDATVIEEGFPDIPDFDDTDVDIEEDKKGLEIEMEDTIPLSSLTLKQQLRIFLPQFTYWSIVFIIISFASITITNSNFTLDVFSSNDYDIGAELFLFGWISFIPMGWFYRYKLNQYNVKESTLYGLIFLILQLLYLGLITIIFFLLINPNAQLATITDSDATVTTVMSTFVYFSFLGFLISGLTFGFVLFFVGYKLYFNQIYEITPASKLSN